MNKEWKARLDLWLEELPNHFYMPLGEVAVSGFVTRERLSLDAAAQRRFFPMPAGTPWGAKWEYGWFTGSLTPPPEAEGRRIVLRPDFGGEALVYLDGRPAGAADKEHHELTLSRCGVPGTLYTVIAEAYAGHGPRVENSPPCPPGRVTVPEPGPAQTRVGQTTFGIWEEEAYQLWMDVQTLYLTARNSPQGSLRAAEIDRGLKDFTLLVDFESPASERLASFRAGRERLRPLLQCVNGSTAPQMYIFGQSHLDLAWLWPFEETRRKCGRTLATQLALLDEYPEYRFFMSQPPQYEVLKADYPDLYLRVKEKISSGAFIPEGGMWVEADTNLPSGESLIRQFLYGKDFFREELGVQSEILWLPDVFGFSASLPQILKGCGIRFFATQKIIRNYNGGDPFPYNLFEWEGIDGSRVLTHVFKKHNSLIDPETVIRRWEEDRNQREGLFGLLYPFGHGDGGGGPTRDHLEYAARIKDLEGVPRTRMSHPGDFFKAALAAGGTGNRYVGELYFQAHRGTLTSQAGTKKGNRLSETALREAELWSSLALASGGTYPFDSLEALWKKLLFNQFHDVLPGTSIRRVHEEAEADYREIQTVSAGHVAAAVAALAGRGQGLVVFNSLSWERQALVALPEEWQAASDERGTPLPVQASGGRLWAEVAIPSCGLAALEPGTEVAVIPNTLHAEPGLLENDLLRARFNDRGELVSLYDKEAGRELAAGPCNSFRLYKDATTVYDAWDIDSMYELLPVELSEAAAVTVVDSGPLFASLQLRRRLHNSQVRQLIRLRRGSRWIDFITEVDWQETHKLLKVAFPLAYHAQEAVQEIQFGHLKRPNHASRQYDADRFEVCNHRWTAVMEANRGAAVLNDCKYGVSVQGGCISLTLLKAAMAPDMDADKGLQGFTYSFYAWNGPFVESGVVREGYELNVPVGSQPGQTTATSFFSLDEPSVILEAVKAAQDRSGDLILRLYECKGSSQRCGLQVNLPVSRVREADMLENPGQELAATGDGGLALDFRPFEIKTLRLSLSGQRTATGA